MKEKLKVCAKDYKNPCFTEIYLRSATLDELMLNVISFVSDELTEEDIKTILNEILSSDEAIVYQESLNYCFYLPDLLNKLENLGITYILKQESDSNNITYSLSVPIEKYKDDYEIVRVEGTRKLSINYKKH